MEPIERDIYRLSTGKVIKANCGIIGISHTDPSTCTEGYDGGLFESEAVQEWDDAEDRTRRFTAAERAEVADYMIGLWQRFKASATDDAPAPGQSRASHPREDAPA